MSSVAKGKHIGIIFNASVDAARGLAGELKAALASAGNLVWMCAASQDGVARERMPHTDVVVSVGGDGTILRAARTIMPWQVPILGVNLGKLGFMTEFPADEALQQVPVLLQREGWVEERAMLAAHVVPASGQTSSASWDALNDIVVGRTALSRVIYMEATIDGAYLTTYKADGVIIATATGSTGYALAAGGPILYPASTDVLVKPIAAHLTLEAALVLPATTVLDITVRSDHQATMSVDGQVDVPLHNGDLVRITSSAHKVRFLRAHPPSYFYATLLQRLRSKSER